MDALSKAIGKKDHPGRVRGIGGVNIGIEKIFGKASHKGLKDSNAVIEDLSTQL